MLLPQLQLGVLAEEDDQDEQYPGVRGTCKIGVKRESRVADERKQTDVGFAFLTQATQSLGPDTCVLGFISFLSEP